MSALKSLNILLRDDSDRRRFYGIAAGLVLSAWLALVAWGVSPYAGWLDHTRMEEIVAPPATRLAVFTLGWALMIVAMMLPGTLLVLARCWAHEPFGARRVAPVILAYLAVWTMFGGALYLGDGLLHGVLHGATHAATHEAHHELAEHSSSLAGLIAPGVLLLAGVYQLSPMKRACLSRCRSDGPVFQGLGHELRAPNRRDLWALGLRHGVYCLGSCWGLMLLMFAAGGSHLAWMGGLGVVMAVERLSKRGYGLAQLLGVVLIVASIVLVISQRG